LLTEEQLEEYYREGYLLARGLVPQGTVRAVLQALPPEFQAGERWRARIFEHDQPEKDAKLHRLLVEPALVEAVTAIFGGSPRVFYGMLAVVAANGGHGLPWHQDNQYTQLLGGALNVFVALCPIREEKAGLWVAPQSHRLGVQAARRNETTAPGHREALVEPENALPLPPMDPGDVCIFDRCTLHRSLTNRTEEDRYAYAAQFQAEHTREAVTGKKDPRRMRVSDLRRLWEAQGLLD